MGTNFKFGRIRTAPDGSGELLDGIEYCSKNGHDEPVPQEHHFLRMPSGKNPCIRFSRGPIPVADFSADTVSGCVGTDIQFTDTSTGSPTGWSWDFGDGETSTEQNPVHQYTAAGTYTVSLTGKNLFGESTETKTDFITISGTLAADFSGSPLSGQAPLIVNFTDTSTGSPETWDWDFGDGGVSADQNPAHQYTAAGDYTVSLTVDNSVCPPSTEEKINYINVLLPATCNWNDDFTGSDGDNIDSDRWDWESWENPTIQDDEYTVKIDSHGAFYESPKLATDVEENFTLEFDIIEHIKSVYDPGGYGGKLVCQIIDPVTNESFEYGLEIDTHGNYNVIFDDFNGNSDSYAIGPDIDSVQFRIIKSGLDLELWHNIDGNGWVNWVSKTLVSGDYTELHLTTDMYYTNPFRYGWDNFYWVDGCPRQ